MSLTFCKELKEKNTRDHIWSKKFFNPYSIAPFSIVKDIRSEEADTKKRN